MKHRWLLGLLALLLLLVVPIASAQPGNYTCADGLEFTGAVNVLLMLTPGTYTVTALSIDGFDPRIAIVTIDGRTEVGCNDDSDNAASYTALLPTTGAIEPSPFNAQHRFSVPTSMNSVILAVYVDGFNDTQGQFLLVVEGGTLTASDSPGDAFGVGVSPAVRASQTPVTAYMIGVDDTLDPLIQLLTVEGEQIMHGDAAVSCDDAGGSLCYGETVALTGGSINNVAADSFDSMLVIPIEIVRPDMSSLLYSFSSFGQTSRGDYIAAFHINFGDPIVTSSGGKTSTTTPNILTADVLWTDNAVPFGTEIGTGVVVTCPPNGSAGIVWGTDVYTNDSSICTAAVHAGLITLQRGGTFGLIVMEGQRSYTGSTRNGVSTLDYGAWDASFMLVSLDS